MAESSVAGSGPARGSPAVIRNMTADDVEAVREVEALAFGPAWAREHGASPRPRRTPLNVRVRLEKDPEGCFVAESGDRVVGYIFSRTWGDVGWFGSFGVLPELQTRGIGKALLGPSLEYLRRRAHIVGLETGMESPYSLGLYLRQGFEARLPTLGMSIDLGPGAGEAPGLPRFSGADAARRSRWVAELAEATGGILPGLDYRKEIESAERNGLGDTLVLERQGRAEGLSIVHLASVYEGSGDEAATIAALALRPAATDEESFRGLISETAAYARANGKARLRLNVCTAHAWAVDRLLAWGFGVERASILMTLRGQTAALGVDQKVDLARWAG